MKKILFVIHELEYTGSPRSTLRMCKVALKLGYYASVWSEKDGPFIEEFKRWDICVEIVDSSLVHTEKYVSKIKDFDMAVCNTIITSNFVRIICRFIPTVWYIREASNLSMHVKNNFQRRYMLRFYNNICCVSEYAASEVKRYTKNNVKIIHNCVEDESEKAVKTYHIGENGIVRFVQFGTLIPRKGYDVLFDAFDSLSEDYKDNAELYFAGPYSENEYAISILQRSEFSSNIHYLGVLKGDDKTTRLSEMDVVVVSSRDESCSLVVLEGAMLSKPLIVTENVGAKYMVGSENGIVVKTGDSKSLKDAIQYMIDNRSKLAEMGQKSRDKYNSMANMEVYTKEMEKMLKECEMKNRFSFKFRRLVNRIITSDMLIKYLSKLRLF